MASDHEFKEFSSAPFSSNSSSLLKQFALNHLGIIRIHKYFVEKELKNGKLVEILKDQKSEQVELFMYYQKHRFVQPKVRHFINMASELNLS